MNENSKFGINSLKYGLFLGIILVAFGLILYVLDLNTNKALGYINYVIFIACLFIFTKMYRDKNLNGYISYGKAFGFSIVILLVATIISTVYSYIMMTVIDPEMLTKIFEQGAEEMMAKGMSDEQIEMSQKMMKPGLISVIAFVAFMFWGTIISLITSAIVKKNEDPFQAMQDNNEE